MKTQLTLLALLTLSTLNSFAQWQADVRLTNDPATSYTSYTHAWCIASSGDSLHVVWFDYRDGNEEIYYKRSTDGGISWGTDTRLTNNSAVSGFPSVAVSGSVIHVVWHDNRDGNYEIYYKRSTDAGVNWGADTRLTNAPASSVHSSVSLSGQVVHVVWQDTRDGNEEIYYNRSTDGGVSWGADTRLTDAPAFSLRPSVSVSGSTVHVVWHDLRDGNEEIYYKRSTDGGVSWGADTRLTNNSANSRHASVSVSGQVVHVVWYDARDGNYEIYYKRSTDGGTSWGADIRLTTNGSVQEIPSVSVSGQVVHVVWKDWREGDTGEIYYKRSTDEGVSWGADIRLTNNSAVSSHASVSVSGQVVHVVWYDNRDGNYEIYYKRDPTGNVVPVELISFNADINGNNVELSWSTATELNNLGFEVQRRREEKEFFTIGFVKGEGTTTESQFYYYIDEGIDDGKYQYRLKQIDFDGTFEYSQIVELEVTSPNEFALMQNYPNPFNPSTKISYSLPTAEFVTLTVFDVLGKEVVTLVSEEKSEGTYEIDFNASELPSGIYFYRLQAGNYIEMKKMVLLK